MNAIEPRQKEFRLPENTRLVQVAEHQKEYLTLPSLITPGGKRVSQWLPTISELTRLKRTSVTGSPAWCAPTGPQPPVSVTVGGLDLR
jgi:hypothetical protein